MTQERVILVDEKDNVIGSCEKLEAHKRGLLHRAFSVILINHNGEILLQKRASSKYHDGGLWSNTCCSHPRLNEETEDAALRRLEEEMGINCSIQYGFNLLYQADMGNGLIEHEFDHVYTGFFDQAPNPNPSEVEDWKFASVKEVMNEMILSPEKFTPWFRIILPKFAETFTLAS